MPADPPQAMQCRAPMVGRVGVLGESTNGACMRVCVYLGEGAG